MANLSPIMVARFWSKVSPASDFQCWEWTGRKNDKGYGRAHGTQAHRIAYSLCNGDVAPELIVRHTCDNPSCCNPNHLIVGTHADNMRDMAERGRAVKGERHPNSRLTATDVEYIKRNPDGLRLAELAAKFGVAKSTVSYVRSGKTWK